RDVALTDQAATFLIQGIGAGADTRERGTEFCYALLALLWRIGLSARLLFGGKQIAHAGRVYHQTTVLDFQRRHACIADAALAGEAMAGRHPAPPLAGNRQEAIIFLWGLVGRTRHFVEDLLEIDPRISFERREKRGGER